jgi:hypothetical protein
MAAVLTLQQSVFIDASKTADTNSSIQLPKVLG